MRAHLVLTALAARCLFAISIAGEHDYYRYVRYPSKLVPGVGRNQVEQEGGPHAVGYKRRTVHWWPRKGQDIVEVPKGAPLRVWTRNKGQKDPEALAGICRSWTASDPETFKAYLIGFRGFGTSTVFPNLRYAYVPVAVLRMENGEQRAVLDHADICQMLSEEDHEFIQKVWEEAYPGLYATVSQDDHLTLKEGAPGGVHAEMELKLWKGAFPRFNGIESREEGAKYPRWGRSGHNLVFETAHFYIIARPTIWGGPWGQPAFWVRPHEPQKQNLYRKSVLEFVENMWTYVEAAGASMPYWRRPGPNYRFVIHVHGHRCAGGSMHCGITDCSPVALGHEFFHSMAGGGWDGHFYETMCNAGQHTVVPSEVQMFNGNFCYPWCNVNRMAYQSSLWFFVLGDNPNWGYGIQVVAGSLASFVEPTPYHTIARLGQKKGLWKNGVRGFGDFFGEYAARMVTCDFVEQHMIRSKYGMPELSHVYPVYGQKNRYRISNAEAPRWCGYSIVRLKATDGAKEIAIDFHGIHDPAQHSDWRACIVAVDADGRARYSPLWNKGKMHFALEPSDKHLWLTVAATPSAFPILEPLKPRVSWGSMYLTGIHAPRYPWEVTLTGCEPGPPHRRQGDVANFDELYGICDNNNKFLDYPTKRDVPIPLAEQDGKLAQEKLSAMLPRLEASSNAVRERIESGRYNESNWWVRRKTEMLSDLTGRVKFLQRNAKGHRHPNGGGFVTDNAHVAATAYVGPNAMVLDGARVEDSACIKGFAVVLGPKTVVSGNAKIGGRAWVFGDLEVSGDARILEAATVTTIARTRSGRFEGQAEITGSAVIKGDPYVRLAYATDQTITGGVVMDYTPGIHNRESGVFAHGRFHAFNWGRFSRQQSLGAGIDAGALYANWQFNQAKAVLLEDSYVNNNGILHGRPGFTDDGEHRCIAFNGKDQYAEAPPSVADFGELTIDMLINRSGGSGGRLFDFGTGEDECFYLAVEGRSGRPALTARHKGKSYSVAASAGIPASEWVRVRVEMDGSTARICIDGKQVARRGFPFRPRDVFIGDRPEGNFIACGRNRDEFFKGRMDHFRIYRKVHKDFSALGPVPRALTQMQEWSERDQQRWDEWEGRRRANEAKLKAGRHGRIREEIRKLEQQRAALSKTARLEELQTRAREAENRKRTLDRKIHDGFRAMPETVRTEKEINELRGKIEAILREIRANSEHVKLTGELRACEKRRGEVEREVRESPKLKAISAKADAADREMREAEERVKRLPELRELLELAEHEKDGRKKRELRDRHSRLFAARRSADPAWQEASVASQRLRRTHHEALRHEIDGHAGRKKMEGQLQRLRQNLNALTAKLRESRPELPKLDEAVRAKQQALNARRTEYEQRARSSADYKKAGAAHAAARKAVEDERKRLGQEKSRETAEIAARIEKVRKEAQALREDALRSAGLLGPNPYPGTGAARLKAFQEGLVYHTTADWDDRTREEVSGKVPLKMKKWLKRVRGY